MKAYLRCIRQDTVCKIVIDGHIERWHVAHYSRHISHAERIEIAFLQTKITTPNHMYELE